MEHTNDTNEPAEHDERHERLCAYLLGELDGGEAAAVERELETDAEYRAERDRIAGTLGLLREHLPVGAGAQSDADVAAAAVAAAGAGSGGAVPPGWDEPVGGGGGSILAGPFLKVVVPALAAASLLFVVAQQSGVLAPPERGVSGRPAEGPMQLALAEDAAANARTGGAPEASVGKGAVRGSVTEEGEPTLERLGYGGGDGPFDARASGASTPPASGAEPAEQLDAETLEQLRALSYDAGAPSREAPASETSTGFVGALRAEGPSGPTTPGRVIVGGTTTGSGDFFLVQGETGALTAPARARAEGPSGPTTGDPEGSFKAVTSSSLLTGSGDFFLGQGETGALTAPARARGEGRVVVAPAGSELQELGYADVDGEWGAGLRVWVEPPGEDGDARAASRVADDAAIAGRVLDALGLERNSLGDVLESLGYLDAGYDGDRTDPRWRDALGRFVEAKRMELLRAEAEAQIAALLADCRRRPGESLRDMFFRHWGERPFTDAADDPVSTFAADVDTASWALARGMLMNGVLPTRAQIRTEEFVNYFDADVAAPTEETFAIHTDLAPSVFGDDGQWLLRVAVAGREVSDAERQPLSLTFVIDTSGSMKADDRLGLVKDTLRQLLTKLDSRDSVTLIGFANEARLVLPRTSAANRGAIEAAILSLSASGGTNVEAGLQLGYARATVDIAPGASHRVVLLSDGVGNIGETDQERLLASVAGSRAQGVYLNTVGVGLGNHNDVFLEQLANRGDGLCNYVDSPVEARRALVDNFTGAFETIARDVKIQVEFEPGRVARYRLLGYENRALADREFRQDDVDAGEVGAGHVVVALYELEGLDLGEDGAEGALATVRVRFKPPFEPGADRTADAYEPPGDDVAREIERTVGAQNAVWSFDAAPVGFARAVCAAQLAEVLRRSHFAAGDSVERLEELSLAVADRGADEAFREFAALVAVNRAALEALLPPVNAVQAAVDRLKYLRYELAREREAKGEPDPQVIASLEARVAELEEQVRTAYLTVSLGPK